MTRKICNYNTILIKEPNKIKLLFLADSGLCGIIHCKAGSHLESECIELVRWKVVS